MRKSDHVKIKSFTLNLFTHAEQEQWFLQTPCWRLFVPNLSSRTFLELCFFLRRCYLLVLRAETKTGEDIGWNINAVSCHTQCGSRITESLTERATGFVQKGLRRAAQYWYRVLRSTTPEGSDPIHLAGIFRCPWRPSLTGSGVLYLKLKLRWWEVDRFGEHWHGQLKAHLECEVVEKKTEKNNYYYYW